MSQDTVIDIHTTVDTGPPTSVEDKSLETPSVSLDIAREEPSVTLVPSPPSIIASYYNRECSYYRNYDRTRMGKTLDSASTDQLESIIHREVVLLEERLLGYLRSQNIPNLDTEEGRTKLAAILEGEPLEGLPIDTTRIAVALCVEKFYREQNEKVDQEGVDGLCLTGACPAMLALHPPDKQGVKEGDIQSSHETQPSQETEGGGTSSHYTRDIMRDTMRGTCPPFPPALREPVFDPCQYPHVLRLYAHFNDLCYDYRNLHGLAGAYYNTMNKRFIFPTVILSALSSITSFVASSEVVAAKDKVRFALGVGIMTSLNAMVQSFSSAYQFDSKAMSHFAAADQYDQLLTEIDFEKSYPSTPNFLKDLEQKILDIKGNCPYLIPNYIKADYYREKEKASESDFIQNKIIRPMRHELREAIASGTLSNYRFREEGELIRVELARLRKLRRDLEGTTPPTSPCCGRKGGDSCCGNCGICGTGCGASNKHS